MLAPRAFRLKNQRAHRLAGLACRLLSVAGMTLFNRVLLPVLLLTGALTGACGAAEDAGSADGVSDVDEVGSDESALNPPCGPGSLRVTIVAPDFTSDIPQKLMDLRITARNPTSTICAISGSVGIRDLNGRLIAVEQIPKRDFPRGLSRSQFNLHGRYLPPVTANVCYGNDDTCLKKLINEPIAE